MCKESPKDRPCAVNTDSELGHIELERETQPQETEGVKAKASWQIRRRKQTMLKLWFVNPGSLVLAPHVSLSAREAWKGALVPLGGSRIEAFSPPPEPPGFKFH